MEFADQALPELQEYSQKWDLALLKSPFRADFERKYNRIMFLNTEISLRTFSPEIVPELQRENALTTEYSKLIASAQIPFEGQVYTVSQLTPLKQDPDDARRAAAWKAEGEWYMQNAEKLDSIYDELVHLRDTMGKKLGHKNYIPLGYDRMGRNCYGQEDVERFRAAVVKHIVPWPTRSTAARPSAWARPTRWATRTTPSSSAAATPGPAAVRRTSSPRAASSIMS